MFDNNSGVLPHTTYRGLSSKFCTCDYRWAYGLWGRHPLPQASSWPGFLFFVLCVGLAYRVLVLVCILFFYMHRLWATQLETSQDRQIPYVSYPGIGQHSIAPTKNKEKPIFRANPRLEAPLPLFFSRATFCIPAITPASPLITKVHHPVIECQVLSLQCGKATAVFVSSRDFDFVA